MTPSQVPPLGVVAIGQLIGALSCGLRTADRGKGDAENDGELTSIRIKGHYSETQRECDSNQVST